jgi:Zn-dependent protease with chaperone function
MVVAISPILSNEDEVPGFGGVRSRRSIMKRVFSFGLTNLAVLVVLAAVLQLLGRERILDERGVGLELPALLASPVVFWFSRQREYRADAGTARLVGARPMRTSAKRSAKVAEKASRRSRPSSEPRWP